MATYVNDLRLKEIATGDEAGTWGTSTNTNLELIAEAFSFGTEAITTNADTHTTTIADGSTDPGRSIYLKYTGTLDSACTITIGPNTVSKLWFIENGTSGSQNIIISQGSGANVTVPAGEVKAIYSDGAGSGAAMIDAFAGLKVSDAAQTNITSLGTLTTLTVDDITINGSTISDSGDLTLDIGGDIILDADGGNVTFKDGGTAIGDLVNSSSDFVIESKVQDKDIIFKGDDGGSGITALTLDMSEAGKATFTSDIVFGGTGTITSATNSLKALNTGDNGFLIRSAVSSAANPSYSNVDDTNTGMFLPGSDVIGLTTGGSERMRIGSNGKIGVATTSTDHQLTVNASAFDGIQLQSGGSDCGYLGVNTDTVYVGAGSNLIFHTGNAGLTNGTERMRIDSSGNVSIGTTSTTAPLRVKVATDANFAVQNTSSTVQLQGINDAANAFTTIDIAGNPIKFSANGSESMRIDSSGKVGIGNSAPLGKLTISNAAGANAPTSITAANTYLQLGSDDYGASSNGKFMIGFGYTDATNTNSPAYIGFEETSSSGDTKGELIFLTRDVVTDSAPTERMRITDGGNIGIGINAPTKTLQIESGSTADDGLFLSHSSGTVYAKLSVNNPGTDNDTLFGSVTNNGLRFVTNNTERAQISADGKLLIGTTSSAVNDTGIKLNENGTCVFTCNLTSENENIIINNNNSTGAVYKMDFRQNNSTKGSISCSSSAVSFNTSSDYRLKENVDYTWDATTRLKQLKPARFNFIADETNTLVDGFLAHEVSSIVPEAITGEKDGAEMQGIDQSKLVPLLVKTIQELEARITALES